MGIGTGRPTVFLDRDGTVIVEAGIVTDPRQLELIAGSAAAIRRLNDAGFAVALLTNQSAIARGWLTEDGLHAIHSELTRRLEADGARLDVIRFCPHHPEAPLPQYRSNCVCRKPEPGMLLDAASALTSDLARSFVVGDDLRDLELSRAGALTPVLVRTGKGRDVEPAARVAFASLAVADDLAAAATMILARSGR